MRKNVGVGKLLIAAALREHHRILDNAIKVEDWSRAEALFVQASIHQTVSLIVHALPHSAAGRPAPSLVSVLMLPANGWIRGMHTVNLWLQRYLILKMHCRR